jgi:7-carboxy-7-deazaguanine synthase (Cx14CxxC type)
MRTRYRVKEIFYTLQGEGHHAGRPAVFCRFTSCNLWTGHERDRKRGPSCSLWCDTDFVDVGPDGGRFATPEELANAVASCWPGGGRPFVVCTGGEPALQLDDGAMAALTARGFEVAIETNGILPLPLGIDWVCVSPKAGTDLIVAAGDELKLVYPQVGAEPERYAHLDFASFRLQPMDGPDATANTRAAIDYCLAHPQWSLSIQTHKLIGVR